jgi:altronate dehydratase large subunit
VIPIYNQYGRGLKGEDKNTNERILAGIGKNPNVGGVVLVGWEEGQLQSISEKISKSGKPVDTVTLIEKGTPRATEIASKKAVKIKNEIADVKTVTAGLSDLIIGAECGGSDTTSGIGSNPATGEVVDQVVEEGGRAFFSETVEIMGAEQSLIKRAENEGVEQDINNLVDKVEKWAEEVGYNINESNPVADNVEGGLTTIEEKSVGAITKGGSKPIQGVLDYGEKPSEGGLYFMDTPAPAQESMTGMIAGGANMILFSTGRGNPSGTPITPVVKISANPETVDKMSDHIDVNISEVITRGQKPEEAGQTILEAVVKIANGKRVAAENLCHRELGIKRVGRWIPPV